MKQIENNEHIHSGRYPWGSEANEAIHTRSSLNVYTGLVSDYVYAKLDYKLNDDTRACDSQICYAILITEQVVKNPPADASHELIDAIAKYVSFRDTRNLKYEMKLLRLTNAACDVADYIVNTYFSVDEETRKVKLILLEVHNDIQKDEKDE